MGEPRAKITTMPVNERFQNGAQDYAAYLETVEGRLRTDLAFGNLEDFLPRSHGQQSLCALDVGSGTGATAVRLARLDMHVTLLDSSLAMLDISKRAAQEAGVTDKYCIACPCPTSAMSCITLAGTPAVAVTARNSGVI